MTRIIPNMLQHMKFASHSTISAPLVPGDKAFVIFARVFHGDEIFAISSGVYQAGDTSHLGTAFQRIASSSCSPITHILRCHHIQVWFLSWLIISYSCMINCTLRQIVSVPWLFIWVGFFDSALPSKKICVGKIAFSKATTRNPDCRQ